MWTIEIPPELTDGKIRRIFYSYNLSESPPTYTLMVSLNDGKTIPFDKIRPSEFPSEMDQRAIKSASEKPREIAAQVPLPTSIHKKESCSIC